MRIRIRTSIRITIRKRIKITKKIKDRIFTVKLGLEFFNAHGKEGIKKFRKSHHCNNNFDVILMDLTMPGGLDGVEASEQIINIDKSAKIISSSGYNTENSLEPLGQQNIFSGTLAKPYDMDQMAKIIEEVIGALVINNPLFD